MKVSFNWLKEFVPINISAQNLAEKINLSVVEVEEIIDFNRIYKGVVIGEIKEIKKHPRADKLSIAKVFLGKKYIHIIFGNLQLKVGDKLPIAVAPTILPGGLEVEKKNIRGIESEGMIVSLKELGLESNNEEEIIFFSHNEKAGTPFSEAFGLSDIVLNLDVLSNRGDLFSHFGVAREVGAILNKKIKAPKIQIKEDKNLKIEKFLEVEIKDKILCPRYQARVIANVNIGESPKWLKNRLLILGIRPVNNVVDITNYVMLEMGQPLHVFDYNKLALNNKNLRKIVVRRANKGEEIITLDEKSRKLTKDILVIADSRKPIAIAGVIGGKNTEVDENTKTIILESANFSWPVIRKASRILGLRTEASLRFEKNLGPELTEEALDHASQLISQIAGGRIVKGKIDKNYNKNLSKVIDINIEKVSKMLSKNIPSKKIIQILNSLGMEVLPKEDKLTVKIPYWRRDLKEEIDLIEEIARIYGYEKIPLTLPKLRISPPQKNIALDNENNIKNLLKGLGVTEVYNYPFIGKELLDKFSENFEDYYQLENPLNPERVYLRKNLIFSMVENAEFNSKNFDDFSIFEIAFVFIHKKEKFPDEKRKISILVYEKKNPFYILKGILEELFYQLNVENIDFVLQENYTEGWWHNKRFAFILSKENIIGKIGELHPEVFEKFDFKHRLAVCEIDFNELFKRQEDKIFKPFSRFPKVVLDISIIVDEKLPEADIRREIFDKGKGLITKVELFDVYRGHQIDVGKKSLAYHITYESLKRTLTDKEVNLVHQKVINALSKKFNARIRNKE